jgi:hypothetical protein
MIILFLLSLPFFWQTQHPYAFLFSRIPHHATFHPSSFQSSLSDSRHNIDDKNEKEDGPREDPNADPRQRSPHSGVLYEQVVQGLHRIYPPSELEQRNAASRTDGYWPYIAKGETPPSNLVYGEFDVNFFATLLDKAMELLLDKEPRVFCDIGSGTGRLVMAAAALHPTWKVCRGIEILNSLHQLALGKLHRLQQGTDEASSVTDQKKHSSGFESGDEWLDRFRGQFVFPEGGTNETEQINDASVPETATDQENVAVDATTCTTLHFPALNYSDPLPLAPMEFVCGSFQDSYFGDANCIFCFSSCMSSDMLSKLSHAVAKQCRCGTVVITTEFPLPMEGVVDSAEEDDLNKYTYCDYGGDFDDPDDVIEWKLFCKQHGIEAKPFQFELLETMDGYNWLTGGTSTAYIHRLVQSAASPDDAALGQLEQQEPCKEELAAMAWIHGLQSQRNANDFYREIRNNMIYHGFSPNWYEGLEE